jgi:hypothetical protein
MADLRKAALAYAARGWPVFPCNSGKMPMTENGVLDATTEPKQIEKWWDQWPKANIGFEPASAGYMVLDHDLYKEGYDERELDNAIGTRPKTRLSARSPRGGLHEFYALRAGEVVAPSASKLAPSVDVRSFHSYILLAPSRTPDGEYEWISEGKAAFRTDEMVRLANIAKEKSADRDNWLIQPDLDENIAAAVSWLRSEAKIAVEGQGGDAMAYATAAHMKSFGISEDLAFDLMWQYWNPRCVPPWSSEEVDHLEAKVRNGYSYNTSPPGNITAAYKVAKAQALFKPVDKPLPSGKEKQAGRFRFVDRAGMVHIKPPKWLIHDCMIQGGYTLLIGSPGTFKTFVALDMLLSIATGVSFPWNGNWPRVTQGRVGIAVGEGRALITKRIEAWERTHWKGEKVSADQFILADPVPMVSEDAGAFIDGMLAMSDGKPYACVGIDTVGKSMMGMNENAQQDASGFTQLVQRLSYELGSDDQPCAVLGLHHTGHGETGRARGSSVFGADADTILRIDRDQKSMVVSLHMNKQKDAAEWEAPKAVKLQEVELDYINPDNGKPMKTTSLVAVMPDKSEVAKAKQSKAAAKDEEDPTVLEIIEKAVLDRLAANPLKSWSTRQLAEAIATDERVNIGSDALRRRHLKLIREDKQRQAHRMYDAETTKWRHVDRVKFKAIQGGKR